MTTTNKVIRNIFSNWAGLVINIIIAFLLSPFIVYSLGNVYYGIWVIMMQLVGYLGLMELGVRESIIRFVAKYSASENINKLNDVVGSALTMYLGISILSLIVTSIITIYFPSIFEIPEETVHVARIIVILTGLNIAQGFVFNVYFGILMGIQRYDIYNVVTISFSIIRAILIVIFLSLGYGIIALGIIQLGINFISNLIVYQRCKNELPLLKSNLFVKSKEIYKSIINYSGFVFLNNMSEKIIFYTDALVIGIFLNPIQVTYYSIPGTLIEYLRRIIIQMNHVFSPLTAELETNQENEKIKELLVNGTKFSLIIGVPFCIIFLTMGYTFIKLWMGVEYAEAAKFVLIILTATQIISISQYSTVMILYGLNKHRLSAYSRMFEAGANIVLSIILVNYIGIEGVAIGTALPNFLVVVFFYPAVITRILDIKLWQYISRAFFKPIFAFLILLGFCILVEYYIPAQSLFVYFAEVIGLLIIYLVVTWFFSFNVDDRKMYSEMIKNMIPGLKNI